LVFLNKEKAASLSGCCQLIASLLSYHDLLLPIFCVLGYGNLICRGHGGVFLPWSCGRRAWQARLRPTHWPDLCRNSV